MANICYTQYRFEGPEEEIRNIGNHFQKAFSLHSYDEADEETQRFVDREFYEQHLNNIIELLYPDCEYGWRGAIRGKITEESYKSLGDGQMVLSFEAESSYVPVNSLWNDALSQWAPNSRYYYYAEEMRLEGIWTNDVFRKYFPWDYAIFASIKKNIPQAIFDFLTKKAEYRKREDQYGYHISYWTREAMREALLKLLPHPEWSTEDLIYVAKDELERFAEGDENLWIFMIPVRHRAEDAPGFFSREEEEPALSEEETD